MPQPNTKATFAAASNHGYMDQLKLLLGKVPLQYVKYVWKTFFQD